MLFAYLEVNVEGKQLVEKEGVIEAPSLAAAVFLLGKQGILVRNIRAANPQDIAIENFKRLQDKLVGKHTEQPVPLEPVEPVRNYAEILFAVLVIIVLVIYFWRTA